MHNYCPDKQLKCRFQGIFFDFDGVIAETSSLKAQLFVRTSHDLAPQISLALEKALVTELVGAERGKIAEWVYQKSLGSCQPDRFLSHFVLLLNQSLKEITVREGFQDLLEQTKALSIFTSIVSAAPLEDIIYILENNGIPLAYFTSLHGIEQGSKSHVIQTLLNAWQLPADQTVLVGDMPSDANAARQAKVNFIRFESELGNQCTWDMETSKTSLDSFSKLKYLLFY